jgi:phosphoribosylglycinamide formyltransferase 1
MRLQVRVAVFASGRGSTFQAIHKALAAIEDAPARIVICISNNPRPGVFEYAEQAGIETMRLSPRMFENEPDYEAALLDVLRDRGVEMIALAGYMRHLPPGVVKAYGGRILNIHPALLPKFGGKGMYGMHVHEAVLAAGETETGPTVHLVDEEYDSGPIVAQERVAVLEDDTPETLAARVLKVEHLLYPRVVIELARRMLAETYGER